MGSRAVSVPAGQFGLGVPESRAEKPCSRLSLSGNPPVRSFQAHWLMSIGSLDPPPVKKLLFGLGSATQDTAVAPEGGDEILQRAVALGGGKPSPPAATGLASLS